MSLRQRRAVWFAGWIGSLIILAGVFSTASGIWRSIGTLAILMFLWTPAAGALYVLRRRHRGR